MLFMIGKIPSTAAFEASKLYTEKTRRDVSENISLSATFLMLVSSQLH